MVKPEIPLALDNGRFTGMSSGLEAEWERFWEKVVRLVRDYIGVKDR